MSNLKRIISQEIDQLVPPNFSDKLQRSVMQSILSTQKESLVKPLAQKDDIILAFTVLFCILLIYFLGFSEDYKLRIYVSSKLIFNYIVYAIAAISLIVFLVNDYFDRKKKILI